VRADDPEQRDGRFGVASTGATVSSATSGSGTAGVAGALPVWLALAVLVACGSRLRPRGVRRPRAPAVRPIARPG
jgi:hypothetical protein